MDVAVGVHVAVGLEVSVAVDVGVGDDICVGLEFGGEIGNPDPESGLPASWA